MNKQATRKAPLLCTDLGLLAYWALTAMGVVSVGQDEVLLAWNWSFLPLDLLAVTAGLTWSALPSQHRWSTSILTIALTLTHVAGLMAISFFLLWGSWDPSWWLVNLWLTFMPIGLALAWLGRNPKAQASSQSLGSTRKGSPDGR